MITTIQPKKHNNIITLSFDPTKIERGHKFISSLRRGGVFIPRKSRRSEKQRISKDFCT